jgi:hypothetical protein
MTNTKLRVVILFALAAGCGEPGDIPQSTLPDGGVGTAPVVTAVFDPTTGNIPLPNDLARQPPPPGTPPLPAAQQELLNLFNTQGGFPSDQELPVTISLVKTAVAQNGAITNTAPTFDPASVNAGNLVVFLKTATAAGLVAIDPITDANYVAAADHGVLTIHNRNRAPWAPGQYIVGLRGGPNGVKTKEGDQIHASQTFYLIAQGHKFVSDQDLTLLRAQTGSDAAARAAAAQLNALIDAYTNSGVFAAVNQVFPHEELAALTAFTIAPVASTVVEVDPGRGIVPLPIDLLRDPSSGKLTSLAACTLAGGTLNAQGTCLDSRGNPSAAVGGFAALDGFSTTGMILAQTSDLIAASTVTTSTVQLWEIPPSGSPVQVNASTYITEPVEVTQSGLSPAIALQPAGATAGDPTSVFRTRPLKDNTDYAVVISDGVKDKTGKSIGPGTVARIVRFSNPISVGGKSQLIGIDDVTAAALEKMRNQLPAVITASGFGSDHVAMAYVFHTQTILSTAVQLGALPYTKPATSGNTGAVTGTSVTTAFAKYGVNGAVVHNANIAEVIETTITTFNLLDPATGAFQPTGTTTDETINVLIARPAATNVPTCSGALAGFAPLTCSPLVVFRHGLGSGRAAMLAVADTFNARGFTVAAIDAAKHGDRSFCTSGQTQITVGGNTLNQCAGGGACTALLPAGAQGDANVIGTCGTAGFNYLPVSIACLNPATGCNWTGTAGIPAVSSNYLVTANFFRTRDTLRQDMIDQSQLVRAVAFAPTGPPPTGHNLFDHMAASGVIIDPTKIYFVGQSLGSIQGSADVAVNPRISTAVLNVGGGTVVDVFTTSPAFATTTNTLLASLGIQPGANSAYLQFLVVAKTILDPADPVNFAGHLTANTLPNLLANPNGTVAQSAKAVLRQVAFCDQVVPNPFNFILYSTVSPFTYPPTGAPGTFQLFFKGTPDATTLQSCPSPTSGQPASANSIPHGFFTDWSAATSQAQSDAAAFLVDPVANQPASLRIFP